MPTEHTRPALRYFWIIGVGLLLLFVYGAALQRYYMFDGDHAIQIMMAKYFSWNSTDFYYWGQNRLGSFVPLLLILPIKVLGLPPLASAVVCSVALYFTALGLLLWQVRSTPERLAALTAFFLIPIGCYKFLLYTGHPYGPTMALTLIAFSLLFRASPTRGTAFVAGCLFSLSCWVSEATIAALIALAFVAFERRSKWDRPTVLVFLIGTSLWVPFSSYWRARIGFEGHDGEYVKLASADMLVNGLEKFIPQFSYMMNSELPTTSSLTLIAAVLLVLTNPFLILFRRRWFDEASDSPRAPLLTFLAVHNCAYFLIIWVSRHSYFGEGRIQRYWVPVIIFSLFELFVLSARMVASSGWRLPAVPLAMACALCASGIILPNMDKWPRRDNPLSNFATAKEHRTNLRLVREHGATHVTGDYWHSLPLTVLSNFQVLAVPRDFSRTERFRAEFSEEARRRNPSDYIELPEAGHSH